MGWWVGYNGVKRGKFRTLLRYFSIYPFYLNYITISTHFYININKKENAYYGQTIKDMVIKFFSDLNPGVVTNP